MMLKPAANADCRWQRGGQASQVSARECENKINKAIGGKIKRLIKDKNFPKLKSSIFIAI